MAARMLIGLAGAGAALVLYVWIAGHSIAPPLPEARIGGEAVTRTAELAEVPLSDTEPSEPQPANDLRTMSETFRNSTLLIAIRDAGFVCDEVVAAYESGEQVWTASCRDMSGYRIAGVDGALEVEPIAHLFDAPVPPVREQPFRLDAPPGIEQRPRQERLR